MPDSSNPWRLIRGVCLYRPSSPDLLEAVVEIARKLEREWVEARAPLRSLISEREFLEKQLEAMQELLNSFSTEIANLRRNARQDRRIEIKLQAIEQMRAESEERCISLQTRIVKMQAEQEALTAQFDELHKQLERTLVRGLMLACGDDREACLHRLKSIREELAQERAQSMRSVAQRGIRASAKMAFQAFTNLLTQKQAQQHMDEVWGWEEEKPRGGGWDCA